jgi:hypothetical protein
MKIAIHQPQYMAWLGYFHKMASVDLFVYLDDVQFKKNEWQHRNRIRSSSGCQWLSVPTTYRFPQLIMEVAVAHDSDWQKGHLNSLNACYAKSPFYKQYIPQFERFFEESRGFKTIDKINIMSSELLRTMVGISTRTAVSSQFKADGVSTERLVNVCRRFEADTYLAGAGGREYMDLTLFEKAGIAVEFQEFIPPVYPQHWSALPQDFVPGLSAIDLIFNCGQQSLKILMGNV